MQCRPLSDESEAYLSQLSRINLTLAHAGTVIDDYVAMTRAKRLLMVITDESDPRNLPSRYIQMAGL
jgi:hypothetical protein